MIVIDSEVASTWWEGIELKPYRIIDIAVMAFKIDVLCFILMLV
jgi:hypothetical protein